jgi:hypothetical protein
MQPVPYFDLRVIARFQLSLGVLLPQGSAMYVVDCVGRQCWHRVHVTSTFCSSSGAVVLGRSLAVTMEVSRGCGDVFCMLQVCF